MDSRGTTSRLPTVTFVIVAAAFAAIAGVLYHNILLEKRLSDVDAGVSNLAATVDRVMLRLESAREEVRRKDQSIADLQQVIDEKEQLENGKALVEQANIASLISGLQPKVDPVVADVIAGAVYKYSRQYGIPPELIVNVAMRESSFRPILESNKKAKGLMQVMVTAHPEKIEKLNVNSDNIFHIDNNIHLGTMILAEYYESKNSIYGALESYVGAELKRYIDDILVGFADMKIRQFRAMAAEEVEKKQSEALGAEDGGEQSTGDDSDEEMTAGQEFPDDGKQAQENADGKQ